MTDEHIVTVRPPVWAILLAVLIAGSFYLVGKNMERTVTQTGVITVNGEGKVTAVPNIAQLSLGVQTGPMRTAKEALDKLSKDMNDIIDAVKAQGVEEKDIKTQSLSMNPSYDWTSGRQVLRGYEAMQTLTVKVRDLDKSGDVLTAATNAGANQSGGVSFTIDDREALEEQARAIAIGIAKDKAEELADTLGEDLGALQSYNEGFGSTPPMYPMYDRAMMGGVANEAKSVPLPEGEQEIMVNVTLTYELK